MKRSFRLEQSYPFARDLVWRSLTDPELIAAWLMPNDFRPEVGHAFTMRTDPAPGFDGIVHCRVLSLEPERLMTWSWRGGVIDTTVSFELHDAIVLSQPATRLVVVHSGFEGLPGVLTSFILQAGSRRIYGERLPRVLERARTPHAAAPPAPAPAQQQRKARGAWWWLARAFAPILVRAQRKRRPPASP